MLTPVFQFWVCLANISALEYSRIVLWSTPSQWASPIVKTIITIPHLDRGQLAATKSGIILLTRPITKQRQSHQLDMGMFPFMISRILKSVLRTLSMRTRAFIIREVFFFELGSISSPPLYFRTTKALTKYLRSWKGCGLEGTRGFFLGREKRKRAAKNEGVII